MVTVLLNTVVSASKKIYCAVNSVILESHALDCKIKHIVLFQPHYDILQAFNPLTGMSAFRRQQ